MLSISAISKYFPNLIAIVAWKCKVATPLAPHSPQSSLSRHTLLPPLKNLTDVALNSLYKNNHYKIDEEQPCKQGLKIIMSTQYYEWLLLRISAIHACNQDVSTEIVKKWMVVTIF